MAGHNYSECVCVQVEYHLYESRVDRCSEGPGDHCDVVQDLCESCSLHLLGPQVAHGVYKVKHEAALLYLPQEKVGLL